MLFIYYINPRSALLLEHISQTCELVFVNELLWDVQDFDANVFGLRHVSVKVEVFKVNGAKAGTFLTEYTVEEELEKLQQCCVCTHISRVADAVATNCDLCAVRVILFRTDFTYNHGMANYPSLVRRDVMVVDVKEHVGTGYTLGVGGLPLTNALVEMAKLIGVRGIPCDLILRVTSELAML